VIGREWGRSPLFGILLCGSFLLISCNRKNKISRSDITILWEGSRATAISIPVTVVDFYPGDSLDKDLQVRLARHGEQPAMAGAYSIQDTQLIFHPLIPFTRGLNYEVLLIHQTPVEFSIPRDTAVSRLLAIFPSQGIVPENLLKIYLVFSGPMVQGHALEYIKLTDEKGDSLPNSFLYLQNELWNEEGTQLTIWLDPGRIKRGLIPNQRMGPPLVAGRHYKLFISGDWPGINGNPLDQPFSKNFYAGLHDAVSPSPDIWKMTIPEKNSVQPLEIKFGEPLDYALLKHAIRIEDSKGGVVEGETIISANQEAFLFIPIKPWSAGSYKILIEGRLEDLAGNNLNRVFDLDLKMVSKPVKSKEVFEKTLQIR
jgi:hypothetical protein